MTGHPAAAPLGGITTRSGSAGQLMRYQSCSKFHFVFIGSSVCQKTSAFCGMATPKELVETSVGAMAKILSWSGSVSSSPCGAEYFSTYGE